MSHLDSGSLESSKIVPTRTVNCLRQALHLYTPGNWALGTWLGREGVSLVVLAVRAYRAVWPKANFKEVAGRIFIRRQVRESREVEFQNVHC